MENKGIVQTYPRNYRHYQYHRGSRLPVPVQKTKRNLPLKVFAVFTTLLVVSVLVGNALLGKNGENKDSNVPAVLSASQPVSAQPETPPVKQIDTSNLKVELEQITKKYPYNTSVAVIDLNSGNLIQTGDTYPYVAASTTKLLTALMYFQKVEQGKVTLDKSIAGKPAREQLKLMINRSDNPAWEALNTHLGINNLEAFAHSQGLKSFDAQKNTVTSDDMARLLAKIYKNESISKEHTELLLSWMQKTQEERFIPSAATPNLKLYHKAGYLPDRIHDVALIDNGTAPFVLVIYSKSYKNDYNNALGQKLFKQITTEVIETFSK